LSYYSLLRIRRGLAGRISRNALGMVLMAVSGLCLTGMHVSVRLVPGDMHAFQIVFLRNGIGLLLLAALYGRGGLGVLRTRRLGLHGLRGLLQILSMLTFFSGLFITPLGQVNALSFTSPLFATALAVLVLGEKLPPRRLLVLVLGVAGTLIIIRPGFSELSAGPLLILVSSLFWGLALIVIKVLARTESTPTAIIYMAIFLTPMSLLFALPVWQWPSLEQLGWIFWIAVLGTTAHMALNQSFRMAEATVVLPLDFLKIIWGSTWGYLFFAEVPDALTWVGGTVIFVSTTTLALREAR
jgi:drug/metabolite transporter (DMT)-like permease